MTEERKAVRYREPREIKKIAVPCACAVVYAMVSFYLILPALNVFNSGFWGWLMSIIFVYLFFSFRSIIMYDPPLTYPKTALAI